MIQSVKALTRMDEYLYLFRDDQLPQNIETMLQGFLYGDPEEGHPYVSQEEFAKRRREFPQLVSALKKLRETRHINNPNYYDANGERIIRRFGEHPPPYPAAVAANNKETKKRVRAKP
jgi:hypothetical protein